nr:ankyrin repeat domain-containing protein [Bacteroidota bacterium]
MQQKLEPKNYNDVLSTLEKINIVLYEKFQNDDGQKEPNKILLKISKDICHYYQSEIASIFNWRYSKKINDVYVKIEALINPQPALPLLNRDIIQVVLSLLHCKDVNRVALFNRDGKLNVDIHIIKRAKDSGYTGLDKAFLAGQYLQSLFNETIEFCNEKLLDAKFFSYKSSNGQTIRSCPEIILNNMKKLPSEQLFQIFCCKKAYDSSHKKVRDFIYIQARGYPISEKQEQFSKEIQKLCSEAMWNACISRELPAVELLFKKGASSDFCGPYLNHNLPAVSIAAYENNMALLKLLLEKGADPNLPASNKSLPLHFAAEKGHLDAVKLLLNNDNMNQIGTHDQTSLHFASIAGKKDVVELLLSYGADLQIQTDYGYTPLHLAAIKGHDDIVKLLLTNGANPNCTADNNRPPMHFAVAAGHCEIVKILLKYKAKLNIVDDDGDTLFHLGAYNGHYKIMELLLKNAVKENINVLNIKRYTPLNLAILQGHVEIVKLLLEHGADVNLQVDGVTALHIATKNSGSPALIELLLNKGGDPNQADIYGTTPLHHASVEDRGDIALL